MQPRRLDPGQLWQRWHHQAPGGLKRAGPEAAEVDVSAKGACVRTYVGGLTPLITPRESYVGICDCVGELVLSARPYVCTYVGGKACKARTSHEARKTYKAYKAHKAREAYKAYKACTEKP